MTCDLESLRNGDEGAWRDFFRQYDRLLQSVASWSKWHFSYHDIKEVTQDIRRQMPGSIKNFKGDASLEYFIKKVSIHVCVDRVRRNVRENSRFVQMSPIADDDDVPSWDPPAGREFDPVEKIQDAEIAAQVRSLVNTMDETCRHAISLFYLKDLSYKEMSDKLGIAVNTVGSRLAKCLDKLRQMAGSSLEAGNK